MFLTHAVCAGGREAPGALLSPPSNGIPVLVHDSWAPEVYVSKSNELQNNTWRLNLNPREVHDLQ